MKGYKIRVTRTLILEADIRVLAKDITDAKASILKSLRADSLEWNVRDDHCWTPIETVITTHGYTENP